MVTRPPPRPDLPLLANPVPENAPSPDGGHGCPAWPTAQYRIPAFRQRGSASAPGQIGEDFQKLGLNRIVIGQVAGVTINGDDYRLQVTKIYPNVTL